MESKRRSLAMSHSILRRWFAITLLAGASSLAAAESSLEQAAPGANRVTRSAGGFATERASSALREAVLAEDGIEPQRRIPRRSKSGADSTLRSLEGANAWIYDARVDLFHDLDLDGYYHYLRVRFDADSYFDTHYVYARLYLSDDGEYWQEYHVTQEFLINGSSPSDDYEVETELTAGYQAGLYDVLIELYDADYGDFLAEYGPADSSAFSLLPLEDLDRDLPPPPVVTVVHDHGGGGAVSVMTLAVLGASWLLRRGSHRRRSL
jgi:hypothetical protein